MDGWNESGIRDSTTGEEGGKGAREVGSVV